MLIRLKLKNFKSVGDRGIDLELKPLTVLVGENGSGKSTILEAVGILSANVGASEFRLAGELARFASYEEIAHRHALDSWITWEIHMPEGNGIRFELKPDSGEEKETAIREGTDIVQFSLEGNRQAGFRLVLSLPGSPFKSVWEGANMLSKVDSMKYVASAMQLRKHFEDVTERHKRSRALVTVRPDHRPSMRKDAAPAEPPQELERAAAEAAEVVESVATTLKDNTFLLSGLRGAVPPQSSTGEWPRWVGIRGEGLLPMLSLMSSSALYEEIWAKVQQWAERFGLPKVKAGIRGAKTLAADYYDTELRTAVNLAFAGQGSRQIISVILQLFWAKPGSLIMIEEPEISLHPESQVKLGALFADAIKEGKQIMISTHSHFLLLALSKAVESGLRADDIAVYHVTKGREGTVAAPVRLNNRGYPLRWPPSYAKVEMETALRWAKGLAKK